MRWFHAIVCLAGLGLLVVLVLDAGPARLWTDGCSVGWAFLPILALSGIEHLLHGLGYRQIFARADRPTAWQAFAAHIAGGAVGFAIPSATLGGEFIRAALVPTVPAAEGAAAVTVDRVTWALADLIPAMGGVIVLLCLADLSVLAQAAMIGALVITLAGVVLFIRLQRSGRALATLAGLPIVARIGGKRLADAVARGAGDFDRRLALLHHGRQTDLVISTALHLLGTCMAAAQLFVFLHAVGLPATIATVIPAFLVGVAVDVVSFFVPGRLGVQEASRALALTLVGLGAEPGVLFALVIRAEQLLWTAAGLTIYAVLLAARRRAASVET